MSTIGFNAGWLASGAADYNIAALDLATIDHLFGDIGRDADHRRNSIGHGFGHRHLRSIDHQRNRFAELAG